MFHAASLPDSRPKPGAKCPAPTPARVCTSCTTGWPSDATSRPQVHSAASANETANRKHHHTVKCAASVILGRACEWKCNIAVARLFSSDTTTLQSPRVSRLIRPCLIDEPSILKKVEHAILGVHLQHDTPDTDDSQHTPPPGGTFMPQSRPQHSHLHDSMQFVKKSRPSAQPR